MGFAAKFVDIAHLTLDILLQCLGKLDIRVFCKCLADMEKNVNSCILYAQILIPLRVLPPSARLWLGMNICAKHNHL